MLSRPIVLFLLLASTAASIAQDLPYKEVRRAMLVEAEVNGRRAKLIVDTGADHTVLSSEMVGMNDADLAAGRFAAGGPGFHGDAVVREAEVKLSSRRFIIRASVMKLETVSRVYGVKIDGLLGQDILSRCGRVSIDYRNKMIELGTGD
jgi:predicted aspartyl protease